MPSVARRGIQIPYLDAVVSEGNADDGQLPEFPCPGGHSRLRFASLVLLSLITLLTGSAPGQQDSSPDLDSLLTAARQAQTAGNFAAAAASYQQAVRLRPKIAELRANLGLMQHEAGEYADAIRSFQAALQLKPSLYVPNLFLGIDYVRTGRPKDAVSSLLNAEKMNPSDPLPPLTLGRAWSSLGDYDAAATAFQRSLRIDPRQSSAWFGLGIAQLDVVEADARTMTDKDANSIHAKVLFAESLANQSRYKEAADSYKTILAANGQPPCMLSEAGFVALRQGDVAQAEAQFQRERKEHPECSLALLGTARIRLDAGDTEAALALVEKLWDLDHGFVTASAASLVDGAPADRVQQWLTYLSQQQNAGDLDGGLYDALTQSAQGSTHTEARVIDIEGAPAARAAQAYDSGRYGECADLLKGALNKGMAPELRMLSACSFFTGDYALTTEAARALRVVSPHSDGEALYWTIKANEKLAFASLAQFQQLEPDSARSHILLGDIYRQRERFEDAQREYAKALDLTPSSTAALLGLGLAYYGNGNVEKAIEIAHQALENSPHDPEINLLLGEALTAQHDFTGAKPYLLEALNAKPQILPHVHALLGQVYAADGESQDAIRELQLGVDSDQDGSLHYRLARLYSKIGDTTDAATALRQMKALQQRRRDNAVIAVQDSQRPGLDDLP